MLAALYSPVGDVDGGEGALWQHAARNGPNSWENEHLYILIDRVKTHRASPKL